MSHGTSNLPSMAGEFLAAVKGAGFDFFAGVPCSLLKGLVTLLDRDASAHYVSATREDSALGMGVGAWLGGKRPLVLMQNSGLGVSVNALSSLVTMYEIPVLLVVSWRGHDGTDAPEHLLAGKITRQQLDLLGIPHRVLERGPMDPQVAWAVTAMKQAKGPAALVVPPGLLE